MPPLLLRTRRLDLVALDAAAQRDVVEDPAALPRLLGAALPDAWPPEAYTSDAEAHAADRLAADPSLQGWVLWYVVHRDGGPRTLAGLLHVDRARFPGGPLEVVPALLAEHDDPGLTFEASTAVHCWATAQLAPFRTNGHRRLAAAAPC